MKSMFRAFRSGLQKTKTSLVRNIQTIFKDVSTWDEETYEDLEASLIAADVGVDAAVRIVDNIRDRYQRGEITTASDILQIAGNDFEQILGPDGEPPVRLNPDGLTVILMVGVNGSGKTTTTAKLGHLLRNDGKSVVLAAADTFRAAGIQQLCIWADRLDLPVVAGTHGGDAAAVAFDAVTSAQRRNADVVIVDTAGRQHNSRALMDELAKVKRIVNKAYPGAPHEVFLTVDASTGTNALHQAREFGRLCEVSGLILTKLDGTGKGGVVVPIRQELGYRVCFVGLGETVDDLQPFDPHMFAQAIFSDETA